MEGMHVEKHDFECPVLQCMLLALQLYLIVLNLCRWWAMQARHPKLENTLPAPLPTSTMWWCEAMTTSCALSTMYVPCVSKGT